MRRYSMIYVERIEEDPKGDWVKYADIAAPTVPKHGRVDPMTALQLQTIGQNLYGLQWQQDLARDLGIAGRTIGRWLAGDSPIPKGIASDLVKLCRDRSAKLAALADELER